jgi:Xaa-Pro aminopeptidase
VPIAPGMVLSNEPGLYVSGQYGIRLENLLLVQEIPEFGAKPFLRFETLTQAPFDRRLIDPTQLTGAELAWLDAYHAGVFAQVGSALEDAADAPVKAWLAAACAPLGQH